MHASLINARNKDRKWPSLLVIKKSQYTKRCNAFKFQNILLIHSTILLILTS